MIGMYFLRAVESYIVDMNCAPAIAVIKRFSKLSEPWAP